MKQPFLDGQAQHQKFPGFEVPSSRDLAALRAGDYVKVCAVYPKPVANMTGERFWIEITEVRGDQLRGVVSIHTMDGAVHGWNKGDGAEFTTANVLAIE